MTTFYLSGEFAGLPIKGDELDEFTDELMDQLLELEDRPHIADPSVGASLAAGTFEVDLTIEAADSVAAHTCFMTTLRTALHAMGMGTPGWEDLIEEIQFHIRNSATLIDA